MMVRRVAWRRDRTNARDDLALALDEVEPSGLLDRHKIVREITACRALVGMRRVLVLALLHHVSGVRKRRSKVSLRVARRVSAGMIEMQMTVDDEGDVVDPNAHLSQAVLESRRSRRSAIFDSVDVVELV